MSGLPHGTRMRILRGSADEAEITAVLLALDAATRADAAGTAGTQSRPGVQSGWQRAARLEGVGRPPIRSRAELSQERPA